MNTYKAGRCGCGHQHEQHRGSFARGGPTSCDRCIFCEEFRPRPVPLSTVSAADLLAPDDADDLPIVFDLPDRRSTLQGRPIPPRPTEPAS